MKNFAVYKSGAGSGKTFTLVKEYLRLAMLQANTIPFAFRRINAITFTNKAAAEMKHRILQALQGVSTNTSSTTQLSQLLQTELNCSAEELQERASILLSYILHHYSDFSIGTIDSFTHKIVKTFAFDLQLPLNFNLETDTKTFYNKVVYELMGQLGQDKELTHWLSEYALTKVSEDETWDPERHLKEFTNLLQNENSAPYIAMLQSLSTAELLEEKEKLTTFIHTFRQVVKSKAKVVTQFFEQHQLNDADFFYKDKGAQRFFYKCEQLDLGDKKELIGSRILNAIQSGKWANDKADAGKKKLLEQHTEYLKTAATDLINFIEAGYSNYKLFTLLQKQIYPILLLKKLQDITLQFKQEEQTVFLSEFNQRIAELVRTEPTPFIYERLGERYHHFLLDEFQDTGELQWQNILPLIDNALAGNFYNLVVGDGKQSIYRWRNANVEQFASLPYIKNSTENSLLYEREAALIRNYKAEHLNTNYRSTQTVVTFNNALFEVLSKKYLHQEQATIYEGQAQTASNADIGYVTVLHQISETDDKETLTFQQIEKHLQEALADGFSYRDVCIITRYNRSGNAIARYLNQKGIPVVSNDSLLLNSVFEVNVIIAVLTYLCNREDSIAPALVIHYLFREGQINLETYHRHLTELSRSKDLFSILHQHHIALYENALRLNNLFDTVCAVINALQLNKQQSNALRFFLDLVNEFLVSNSSNLLAFLDWWEIKKRTASLIIPDNANAVKIMSIHASKGLEFPVVIAPFCTWTLYQFENAWIEVNNDQLKLKVGIVKLSKALEEAGLKSVLDKEQQLQNLDNLNLLYVQLTRAITRLHIIAIHGKTGPDNLAHWLQAALPQLQLEVNETNLYSTGQRLMAKLNTHKTILPVLDLPPLHIEPVSDVIKLKAAYQLDEESEQTYAREKGVLVHYILSKIKTAQDATGVIERTFCEGLLKAEEKEAIHALILQIIQHPLLERFFQKEISTKTEASILTATGAVLRPDRLVIEGSNISIIDYKTGERNDERYMQQLQMYGEACRALGFTEVYKYLVYVNPIEVVQLH